MGGGRRQPLFPQHARHRTARLSGGTCCGDGGGVDAGGPVPTPHATRAHTGSRERDPSWLGGWNRSAARVGEHHPVRDNQSAHAHKTKGKQYRGEGLT